MLELPEAEGVVVRVSAELPEGAATPAGVRVRLMSLGLVGRG